MICDKVEVSKLNIIFLHGALQTKEVFDPLIQRFRDWNPEWLGEISAVDLPGHGSAETYKSGYRPQDLAPYIIANISPSVLEAPTLVVAQSFSGITATTLPELNENIVGVVMLDTPLRVGSTLTSMALLVRNFQRDPERYEWIPRLLRDFFHCDSEFMHAASVEYYDYIAKSLVPMVMITGVVKEVRALGRKKRESSSQHGVEEDEATERIIVGTHKEVVAYAKKHDWSVSHISAGACFTDEDLAALQHRNVNNLQIYALRETGHNVLVARNIRLIAEVIDRFAKERLKAWKPVGGV